MSTAVRTDRRGQTALAVAILLAVLAAVGIPIGVVLHAARTEAAFGDTEQLGRNRIRAATLDVAIGSSTTTLTVPNMAPGDRAGGQIEVRNPGDLPLRYSLVSESGTGALADWLRWDLWHAAGTCGTGPGRAPLLADGVTLRDGQAILGDPAPGVDPGDRRLAPGSREILCVSVLLAQDAPNTVQAANLRQRFDVLAEHDLDAAGDGRLPEQLGLGA